VLRGPTGRATLVESDRLKPSASSNPITRLIRANSESIRKVQDAAPVGGLSLNRRSTKEQIPDDCTVISSMHMIDAADDPVH
jgi:hypothetical protein